MPKILLVEDENVLRDAYAILLNTQEGYELHTAINGREAIELLKENTYDLILLDLMMPVLDGVGFLKEAVLPESSPATRVVILSNLSGGEELKQVMQLGVHRNAVKSDLDPAEFIEIVRQELHKSK